MSTMKVKLADLRTNTFVRMTLNPEHVLYLAELVENGVALPPILVTNELEIADGRHRRDAYELCNITEVEVEVVQARTEADLISLAYRANVGGALPPTPQDTEHTVMLLIEKKQNSKQIAALLGLPPTLARKYVKEVESKLNRLRLMQAVDAVAEGKMTAPKAAEAFDLDVETVRSAISGKKKRALNPIAQIRKRLTWTFKSIGSRNGSMMKTLLEKFEDGDVSAGEMEEIISNLEKLHRQSGKRIADWRKRFEVKAQSLSASTALAS